jgi:hypothetical protein
VRRRAMEETRATESELKSSQQAEQKLAFVLYLNAPFGDGSTAT